MQKCHVVPLVLSCQMISMTYHAMLTLMVFKLLLCLSWNDILFHGNEINICHMSPQCCRTYFILQKFCEARQGHLVVPDSMAEQLFLETYLDSMRGNYIHL